MPHVTVPNVVLVVEDEALVRMLATDVLSDAGYRVIEAVNAEEALTLLSARPDVSVMVTDVNMPGSLDGFGLARLVSVSWPKIGIIVVSGRLRLGPGDLPPGARYCAKPYSPSLLLRFVQEALSASPCLAIPGGAGSDRPILLKSPLPNDNQS